MEVGKNSHIVTYIYDNSHNAQICTPNSILESPLGSPYIQGDLSGIQLDFP